MNKLATITGVFILLALMVGVNRFNSVNKELYIKDSYGRVVRYDRYYEELEKDCALRKNKTCCLSSVEAMKKNIAEILPDKGCSDGFKKERLNCVSSYEWCEKKKSFAKNPSSSILSNTLTACTIDVKECPNGTYVGRHLPDCEFAACSE